MFNFTTDEIKIRMLKTVRPDPIIAKALRIPKGTILEKGKIYPAKTNFHGAVSALTDSGEWMGIVHGIEFEFMQAPAWLLRIHKVGGL